MDEDRVPAVEPGAGEWTGDGSGGDSGDSASQIDAAIKYLEANAEDGPTSNCATYVREALNAGGIDVGIPPIRPGEDAAQARDYGSMLTTPDVGFEPVLSSTQPATPPNSSQLQAGDVAIIQSTSTSPAGHMAMYNGRQWISDYKQPAFWPGPVYRAEQPSYTIYRLP